MSQATFLNGGTISQLRGLAWLALSNVGSVVTRGGTTDSGGGISGGTAAYGSAVPCRIDPMAGSETLIAGRIDERSTHTLTVPYDTALSPARQFIVAGRGTYEVTAERERTGGQVEIFEVVKRD